MEELDGVPEIVQELKNKARSYAALANMAGVSTGHKTLGGSEAWTQLQMNNEEEDYKLPIQIEEEAIETALKGGYNLKFHESFDKVGNDGKHEHYDVNVNNGSDEEGSE